MEPICPICGVKFEKKHYKQKFCSNLCYKEYKKEYQKEYQKTDKYKKYKKKYEKTDKNKKLRKESRKKSIIELKDSYIKRRLGMSDVPKELIEAKREQLKLFRLIKQMS